MAKNSDQVEVEDLYNKRANFGRYSTLAPGNQGGKKSKYVADVFEQALLQEISKGEHETLLDFGCGTGIFMSAVAGRVNYQVGFDISPGMLDVAGDELKAYSQSSSLLRADGTVLPFADASFDAVVAREVLCHFPNEAFDAAIKEIKRVIKPGGTVYLLDQVAGNPEWRDKNPEVIKRQRSEFHQAFANNALQLKSENVVREPRFPWIYPVWFGLIPNAIAEKLARWEVSVNRRFNSGRTSRWHDVLFILTPSEQKPSSGVS